MAKSKKGHNFQYFTENTKILITYLNINPRSHTKYQYPSSSGSQDIVLKGFYYDIMADRKRGVT